jgi:hypothetical protein
MSTNFRYKITSDNFLDDAITSILSTILAQHVIGSVGEISNYNNSIEALSLEDISCLKYMPIVSSDVKRRFFFSVNLCCAQFTSLKILDHILVFLFVLVSSKDPIISK